MNLADTPMMCSCGWRGLRKEINKASGGCPRCGCDCDLEEDYEAVEKMKREKAVKK